MGLRGRKFKYIFRGVLEGVSRGCERRGHTGVHKAIIKQSL